MDALKSPAPLCLSGNVAENWKRFLQRLQLYLTATGSAAKDEKIQASIFLHVIGDEALEVYNTFTFENDEDKLKLTAIIKKFEEFCIPKKNVVMERFHFNQALQMIDESFDQFITRLKKLAQTCEFGTLQEGLIRDRVVVGLQDNSTRERLLRERDLTLDKAYQLCKAAELVKIQMKELKKGAEAGIANNNIENEVNVMFRKQMFMKSNAGGRGNNWNGENTQKQSCSRCGRSHAARACPAFGKTCMKCKRPNHFARCCRLRQDGQLHEVTAQAEQSNDEPQTEHDWFMDSIRVDSVNTSDSDWICPLLINDVVIPVKLDTGAQVNILTEKDYKVLPRKPKLSSTPDKLFGYTGVLIPVTGKCILMVQHNKKKMSLLFYIVPTGTQSILSRAACESLNLVRLVQVQEISNVTNVPDKKNNAWTTEFADVFAGLGCLPGKHEILVDETVPPVVHPCRRIPFLLHNDLKAELDRMLEMGVIAKVEKPTDWVSSIVVVKKKNGKLRICLDPRDLNRAIKRQHYKLPTREEVMAKFAGAKVFSKLDASQGFWQMELDEKSSYLCTFNTPFGRYRFKRLAFGIASAPEVYHKAIHELFEGIANVDTTMDDIIIWGKDQKEHDEALRQVLEVIRSSNLKLNIEKCEFTVAQLTFLGDLLTAEGVKPDDSKVSAIVNMKKPTCVQDVQRFLGMITYMAKWIPELSQKAAPLRQLLNAKNEWQWDMQQEAAWQLLRGCLSERPVLQYYDPQRPIKLSSDASKDGLGATILQLHDQKWLPVAYASRAMTDAETRYAQIEKELLSIVFGCQRFHQFVFGAHFIAETDHKPLVNIFQKPLNDCPIRIQRLLLTVQRYDLQVVYTPGKQLVIADTLSRATDTVLKTEVIDEDVTMHVNMILHALPVSDERLCKIRTESAKDSTLQQLQQTIKHGWPDSKSMCAAETSEFWSVRDELSIADGLVLRGNRIVIPRVMRAEVLNLVHEGHLGMTKCRSRAREVMYWPGMSAAINQIVSNCNTCQTYAAQQVQESLKPHDTPYRPWQKVGSDLFTLDNKTYLIVADYYSLYPEITMLTTTTSKAVIFAMQAIFARHGTPEILFSDNGPQYSSSEFAAFATEWGFQHLTSSPHFPRSNGLAESVVKIVKQLLKKNGNNIYKALQAYRAAPLQEGKSPAQLLMGRRIRTFLPALPIVLQASADKHIVEKRKEKQQQSHNRRKKELPELRIGDLVRVWSNQTRLWDRLATVQKQVAPRSFEVRLDNGATLRRNRRALKKVAVGREEEEVQLSIADDDNNSEPHTPDQPTPPDGQQNDQLALQQLDDGQIGVALRRSTRVHHAPDRLIQTC